MRAGGWRHRVGDSDWTALVEHYAEHAPIVVKPIADVIDSIAASSASHELLFATSMWDLVVTPAPSAMPPVDVVIVRSAVGMRRVAPGHVLIEHVPLVGHADAIERAADEAVALFWRFMSEKYGVLREP